MSYETDIQQDVILPFAELYEFEISSLDKVFLTSYYKEIDFNGIIYTPATLKRDSIKSTLNAMENSINVYLHIYDNFAESLLKNLLTTIKLTITRYFLDSKSYKIIFVGYISSISLSNLILTMRVSNIVGLNIKSVPVIHYQGQCNNSLFDNRCGVNKALNSIEVSGLVKLTETSYQHPDIATKPDGYFSNGVIQVKNDFRLIVAHAGDTVNIQYPFDYDITQEQVYLFAGCNKTIDDCRNKFNNEQNFLGFPYIPTSNPVIWGVK